MADQAEMTVSLEGVHPELRADLGKQVETFSVHFDVALGRVASAEPMSPMLDWLEGVAKPARQVNAGNLRECLYSTASIGMDLSGILSKLNGHIAKLLKLSTKNLESDLERFAAAEQLDKRTSLSNLRSTAKAGAEPALAARRLCQPAWHRVRRKRAIDGGHQAIAGSLRARLCAA